MLAIDQEGLSSGWMQVGKWEIFTGPAVAPTQTLTPANGTGNRQVYQFTASDLNSAGDIKQMIIAINSTFVLQNACYILFLPGSNVLYLASDDTRTWSSVQMGTAQTAQNSACSLSGIGASVLTTANTVSVTIPVSFSASFAGQRYAWAITTDYENLSTGWQKLAFFTVQ
jgi:hypothetical protein